MSGEDGEIPPGTFFRTLRGGHGGRIDALLGAGGQGAVYAAALNGACFAIKWYHPSYAAMDVDLRPRLSRAIANGPPDSAFLWPIDLVEIAGQPSFGYIMRLRDPDYAGMRELIARPPARIEPSLAVRANICRHIADSFLELHASGFCYQDINFGNIFFHPETGSILICDNDNVDIDGAPASVYGTRKFMAPEIVRREAMPSTKSDLFSMAVLFFYVLHAWHPLDGKREAAVEMMNAAAETQLYGTQPVFMYDPADSSNGPLAGMHEPITARWLALPAALRGLFIRAFTVGLHQPGSRVQESEWRAAFAALANASFACTACGFEQTVEAGSGGAVLPTQCLGCGGRLRCPPVLTIGRHAICLTAGRSIAMQALMPGRAGDQAAIGASVEAHPTRPDILGLRNRTGEPWRVQVRDGSVVAVPPGSTVRLLDGTQISFGAVIGLITAPDAAQPATAQPATAQPVAGGVR